MQSNTDTTPTTELIITPLSNPELIIAAQKLPNTGILVQQGLYSFLKIADNYIHELFLFLPPELKATKPDYFSPSYDSGAHITFGYPEELVCLNSDDVGQEHEFTVKDFWHARLGNKNYFVITVESPTLTALRLKYNLDPQPQYNNNRIDFHVTIGIRQQNRTQ